MAVTLNLYHSFINDLATGIVGDVRSNCKLILTTSGYTPDLGHHYRSEITNEITDSGYTAGGIATTVTTSTETGNRRMIISLSPAEVAALLTARYGIFYKSLGGAASADPLIAYLDFESVQTRNPFSITTSSLRFNY